MLLTSDTISYIVSEKPSQSRRSSVYLRHSEGKCRDCHVYGAQSEPYNRRMDIAICDTAGPINCESYRDTRYRWGEYKMGQRSSLNFYVPCCVSYQTASPYENFALQSILFNFIAMSYNKDFSWYVPAVP